MTVHAAGHTRVKIKVGLPGLDEDLERVAAVRRIVIDPKRPPTKGADWHST